MREKRRNLVICLFLMLFLALNVQTLDNKDVATRPEAVAEEDDSSLENLGENDLDQENPSEETSNKVKVQQEQNKEQEVILPSNEVLKKDRLPVKKAGISSKKDKNLPNYKKPEKPHEHIWGKWNYKDEQEEKRACITCGEEETQRHCFISKVVKIETLDKDGAHELTLKDTCYNCGYKKTEKQEEGCSKYLVTGNRKVESKQDGTHIVKTTTSCKRCGDAFETTEVKNCSYTIKQQETESNFNGTHKVDSKKVCKYCDYSYLESLLPDSFA